VLVDIFYLFLFRLEGISWERCLSLPEKSCFTVCSTRGIERSAGLGVLVDIFYLFLFGLEGISNFMLNV
jgi:hypothetical protein